MEEEIKSYLMRFKKSQYNLIEELAKKDDRSFASMMRIIIQEGINNLK